MMESQWTVLMIPLRCGVSDHPTFTSDHLGRSVKGLLISFPFIITRPCVYFIWKDSLLFRALFGALQGVVNVFPLHQHFSNLFQILVLCYLTLKCFQISNVLYISTYKLCVLALVFKNKKVKISNAMPWFLKHDRGVIFSFHPGQGWVWLEFLRTSHWFPLRF